MTHVAYILGIPMIALACSTGCSSPPAAKPAAPLDKIQGKAQVLLDETSGLDAALNAGGPSVYLVDGLNRYRLFFGKPFEVEPAQEYAAEGIYAQKAIDAIGDPAQGKDGYPLKTSCVHVVRMAWPSLSLDTVDAYSNSLRAKVNRFPARAVFLVTRIEPVTSTADSKQKKDTDKPKKDAPTVTVPADKQRALLVEGPTVLPAPLWEPAGGTARCKVVIDEEGKIAELNSGSQLCETVPWAQFRYHPTLTGGHPARVKTEVEVRFDARK